MKELGSIYVDNKDMVTSLAKHIFKTNDVDDLVQEVFLHIYSNLPFSLQKKSKNWVYIIAKNKLISIKREEKNIEQYSIVNFKNSIDFSENNIFSNINDKQVIDLIITHMHKYARGKKVKYVAITLDHFFNNLSYKEVAKKYNLTQERVRQIVSLQCRYLTYAFSKIGVLRYVVTNPWGNRGYFSLITN